MSALRPGSDRPELGEVLGGLLRLELGEIGLDLGADRDRRDAVDRGEALGDLRLVDVGDVEHRLHRQQVQVVDELALLGGHLHLRGAVALVHPLGEALEQLDLRDGRLVVLGLLLETRHRALDGAQVGEHELGADRLDVALRVHAALDVDDVLVGEVAHDLADRVGLADVGEELVAETLALARALHEAGDVDELHDGGHDPLRARRSRRARRGASRARSRGPRSARWWRTGSSRRPPPCG